MKQKKISEKLPLLIIAGTLATGCTSGTSSNDQANTDTSKLQFYTDSQAQIAISHINLTTNLKEYTKRSIYVKNSGKTAINVSQGVFTTYINGLRLVNNSCSAILKPNEICSFSLEFRPTTEFHGSTKFSYNNNSTETNNNLTIKLNTSANSGPYMLEYWCGFSPSFCGQSTGNDVNHAATHVIMAFANTNADGSISIDGANWPTTLISQWQAANQQVLLSVGGQNVSWTTVFTNPITFAQSVTNILNQYGLNGVDLDIENGSASPQQVADTINILRSYIGENAILTIAPQNVGVYQASPIPSLTAIVGVGSWNFFVPVLQNSLNSISLVMQQDYNNWYGGNSAIYNPSSSSVGYLANSYLNWLNSPYTIFPANWGVSPIADFAGVPVSKLVIGIPAAENAANSGYYPGPTIVQQTYTALESTPYNAKVVGFMMWDSSWDSQNNYTMSNAISQILGF